MPTVTVGSDLDLELALAAAEAYGLREAPDRYGKIAVRTLDCDCGTQMVMPLRPWRTTSAVRWVLVFTLAHRDHQGIVTEP